jgi:hypothetical protein
MALTGITENRRFLGYFLSGLTITIIMLAGFAKNFYLRAWIGTRPITPMVHVHGLVMTAWILTCIANLAWPELSSLALSWRSACTRWSSRSMY